MTQLAHIDTFPLVVTLAFPEPSREVLPGVSWGDVAAFPTPAYWAYQVTSARIRNLVPKYQLGRCLVEEVCACLLGGHGLPAAVGLAAFQHLRLKGVFKSADQSIDDICRLLSMPLEVNGRSVHYRFARQKAKYLKAALDHLHGGVAPLQPKELRAWLMEIPGIGFKTASWVVRNWLDSDDVAILDVHILRVGRAIGLFSEKYSVERNYLELEELFVRFSKALGVRASELDAIIWAEMAASPLSVRMLEESFGHEKPISSGSSFRTNRRRTDTQQLPLALH
jgi:thermostable 8-oxoguanine DNA glycosylase